MDTAQIALHEIYYSEIRLQPRMQFPRKDIHSLLKHAGVIYLFL